MRRTTGFALRVAAVATALVVGPATLAPGTAEAPVATALAGESGTTAQRYGWRTMQWDFAWEFGESLTSRPYRGEDIAGGRWIDESDGTGRVVKYGGGLEFHSGWYRPLEPSPDFGTTTLTLQGKPARLGRWELRERSDELESGFGAYSFVIELIPEDPAKYDCGAHNLTIAQISPGTSGDVTIGVNAGTTSWTRTLTGYRRPEKAARLYAVQVTGRRITWFVDSRAVASLAAADAIPQHPMTLRMRLVGRGTSERRSSIVKIDWVRSYDLDKGTQPPKGQALTKGTNPDAC